MWVSVDCVIKDTLQKSVLYDDEQIVVEIQYLHAPNHLHFRSTEQKALQYKRIHLTGIIDLETSTLSGSCIENKTLVGK